jgi:hypothetical protein
MKKFCLIYANCQGRGVETFLKKVPGFTDLFHLQSLDVTDYVHKGMEVPESLFPKAELFIYQPIRDVHGNASTAYLKRLLPVHCESVSFPYIYNDALWPVLEDHKGFVGHEPILELFSQGHSIRDVLKRMFHQQIDFRFAGRFERSLAMLRDKEAETDVKASDFIVENLRTRKLFLTHAHPTSAVFIHCVNQIAGRLGLPKVPDSQDTLPNETRLPDCWPTSPYERDFYGYRYRNNWRHLHAEKMDSNWKRFYVKLIGRLHHPSGFSGVWSRLYVKVLRKKTLVGKQGYVY